MALKATIFKGSLQDSDMDLNYFAEYSFIVKL